MRALQQRIVSDFEKTAGRHDDPRVYGGPPGDPGLLGPDSVSWTLHADLPSVALAGIPAIVLEILHPSVIAGVQDRSSYREDPFRRARSTLGYVLATTFGNTEAATAVIERVKRMHSRVSGTRPDGVAYRALDPELVAWVHTCIPWMILRTYERFCRPLEATERDRYLAEQSLIGRMGGAEWVPTSVAELDRYVEDMRPKLAVNAQTREFLDFLLAAPFVPKLPGALDGAVHRLVLHAGMSIAPRWAHELTGFGRPSPPVRALLAPQLHAEARVQRWAFGTPAYARLARERAFGAPATRPRPAQGAPAHRAVPGTAG